MRKFYYLCFLFIYMYMSISCGERTHSEKYNQYFIEKEPELSAKDEQVSNNIIIKEESNESEQDTTYEPFADDSKDLKKEVAKPAKSNQINLHDFGVVGLGQDETSKIQKALYAAVGKTLYIPAAKGQYYLSGQLIVPSDITIICEKAVVFKAKDDLKQGIKNFEVLFRFENAKNVIFNGNGARFFMNKSAYSGEHNHLFMINGASDITLTNIKAENAGGDGFYVGGYKTKKRFSENIKIKNVKADNNRRQGISVTSAKDLLVENCHFSNTKGTRPEAGVDIEPSLATDILENIRFKDCVATGNSGRGFAVILIKNNADTRPVDITFENCKAVGNSAGFSNGYFSEASKGVVRFIDCVAENSKEAGFWEGSCAASGASKEYIRCIAINNNVSKTTTDAFGQYAAFRISNFAKMKKKTLGNSTFVDCQAINNGNKSRMDYGFSTAENVSFQNVNIKNFVSKGHTKEEVNLDMKGAKSKVGIVITK